MKNYQQIKVRFSTSPELCKCVYQLVDKMLTCQAVGDKTHNQFMLAVGEAIDNANIHGNKSVPNTFIDVEFTRKFDKLSFAVSDQGKGFNFQKLFEVPLSDYEGQKLVADRKEHPQHGGLGLALIRKCINEIIFSPTGNQITLIKNL